MNNTTWQANGETITLRELCAVIEEVPIRKISIEQLEDKLLYWDNDSVEIEKIENVDLSYPIIVLMRDAKVERIVDGNHRIHKAKQKEYHEIDAKIIDLHDLPNRYRKVFS